VTGNYILGGIQVNLDATGDQVTTFNGSANGAIQTGFESIDFSAITGSSQADITAIKTGSTIVGTRNADQITGGAGTDSITMGVSGVALAYDAINAGAGTDTLVIVGTVTTSTTESQNVIDLSSTSDQVGTVNNATESAVQIGIENVDLSGLTVTSGGGFTITAAAAGSNIIGTADTDVINGGAGVDTINGGDAGDTIRGGSGADIITVGGTGTEVIQILSAAGAGGGESGTYTATATNSVSTAAFDKYTGMAAGDTIKLLTAYTGNAGAPAGLVATSVHGTTLASATLTLADNSIHLIRGTYTASTNTFVGAAAGVDSLLIYDADATATTSAYEAVVLIGYNGGSAGAAGGNAGLITLGAAA
jgi:hypothetical protein